MAKSETKDPTESEIAKRKKRAKTHSQEDSSESARITLYMEKEQFRKLKALAFRERIPMKDIVSGVLDKFLASKQIDPLPSKTKILNDLLEDFQS